MPYVNCFSACAIFVMLLSDNLQLARVPLRGVRSKDDFIARVKEAVRGMCNSFFVPIHFPATNCCCNGANTGSITASFGWCEIWLVQLLFSAEIMFFSHNILARTVFFSQISDQRTRPTYAQIQLLVHLIQCSNSQINKSRFSVRVMLCLVFCTSTFE